MANHQIGVDAGVVAVQGTPFLSEAQTITGGATAGTFKIRFGTEETAAIAFDATAATIQAALRALSNISATGISCTGGPLNTTPVVCTFAAEYAAVDVPVFVIVNVDFTGGTITAATTTAPSWTPFNDTDMNTIAGMRARLAAINGSYYTAARLESLTFNDMKYALRVHDAPQTIN